MFKGPVRHCLLNNLVSLYQWALSELLSFEYPYSLCSEREGLRAVLIEAINYLLYYTVLKSGQIRVNIFIRPI